MAENTSSDLVGVPRATSGGITAVCTCAQGWLPPALKTCQVFSDHFHRRREDSWHNSCANTSASSEGARLVPERVRRHRSAGGLRVSTRDTCTSVRTRWLGLGRVARSAAPRSGVARARILLPVRSASSGLVVELAQCPQLGPLGMALEKGLIALEDRWHERLYL